MAKDKKLIAVWFSCGAASAVAAKMTLEKYGSTHKIQVLNNPVQEEHPDNRRFLKDCELWLGVKIESVVNPRYPEGSASEVWEDRRGMSFPKGAPCTIELKKNARRRWEQLNRPDYHVLGFVAGEEKRHRTFLQERPNTLPVLIDAGITKQKCIDILQEARIKIPIMYDLGFPNANCIGCVKATSPTYWNAVREHFPDVFKRRAEQCLEYGSKLVRVKGKRIQLDELDPSAKGRPLKSLDVGCGIFCK